MYMNVLSACIHVHYMCEVTYVDQKRASDSLELELEIVVSSHVDAGNETWVL